jgi:hypothetical protein
MDFHDVVLFLFFMAHYLPDGLSLYLAVSGADYDGGWLCIKIVVPQFLSLRHNGAMQLTR